MQRKVSAKLDMWAADPPGNPLLIRGARRVGKTYAVRDLGERLFPGNFAYCDFQVDLKRLEEIFAGPSEVERIVSQLSVYLRMDIHKESTLIAFDEVQLCEKALNALRFFSGSGYRVIATGSQLGTALKGRRLPFPSDVGQLHLRPMDFEEFLWALGEQRLARGIRSAFDERAPFILHDEALELYRRYTVVGGMPAAVALYVGGGDMRQVQSAQAQVDEVYVADMALYAPPSQTAHIRAVWESLPQQLARETSRKFKYSDVSSGGRERTLREPLAWLEAAEIVLLNRQTNETCAPLVARDGGSFFKVYLADVGILYRKFGLAPEAFLEGSSRRALSPRMRGALAENYVLQALVANGQRPFYWTSGTSSQAEVEFVMQDELGNVIPVEVKSGRNTASKSFGAYMRKTGAPLGYRLSENNFGMNGNVFSVPLYAAFCL